MRLISQDGTSDVPYERYSVCVIKDEYRNIYHIVCDYSEASYRRLAEYSTEEKANKAMEMLREAYIGMPIVMQNVDVSEDVSREFERLKKCGIMVQTENQPSKIECISNAIFQFPTEEELE